MSKNLLLGDSEEKLSIKIQQIKDFNVLYNFLLRIYLNKKGTDNKSAVPFFIQTK